VPQTATFFKVRNYFQSMSFFTIKKIKKHLYKLPETSAYKKGDDMIAYLYFISGLLTLCMYFPQLKLLWKDQTGASSTSIIMWGAWSMTSCVTLIYASTNSSDFAFQLISLGNFAGCSSVFILTVIRQANYRNALRKQGI